MSTERLPRQTGIVIRCNHGAIVTRVDGKDIHHAHCKAVHYTGNTRVDVNREYAAKHGWRRDSLPTPRRKMLDICPGHAEVAKQIIADRKASKEAKQKKRDEAARARLAKKAA
jgi:hypothetical protein